jgi:hypothetical protein
LTSPDDWVSQPSRKRGTESGGSLLLKNDKKMAELPKDIVPYGGVGLFVSPFDHIQKEVISKAK